MKHQHFNYVSNSGKVYCHHLDILANFVPEFITNACYKCPYFLETLAGFEGVICNFDDACDGENLSFDDAGDSELHSKMAAVRLGMKTKDEVLRTLKSYNDYSDEEEIDEEDVPPPPEKEDEK